MAARRPAGGDIAALLKAVEAAERQAAAVHAECENAEANRDDVMRELNQVTEVVAAARQSLRGGKIREARLHKISEQKQLAQLQLDNTLREFAMSVVVNHRHRRRPHLLHLRPPHPVERLLSSFRPHSPLQGIPPTSPAPPRIISALPLPVR